MTSTSRFGLSPQRRQLLESLLRAEGIERSPAPVMRRRPHPAAPVPLTFPQRRLWFLDQFTANGSAYVISAALRVHGPFRFEVFTRACEQITQRHEVLRTVFFETGGHAFAQVRDDLRPDVREADLRAHGAAGALAEVRRREAELTARPFDLAAGPLLRVELLRLGDDDAAVLLSMHHMVSDRWSMGVLLRELTRCYGALLTGTPAGLPELPVQYGDFAVWQQESASEEAWAPDISYWATRLSGAPTDIGLAADRPRPKVKSYRGSSVPVRVPAPLLARLRDLGRSEGATAFMVLAAAFTVLLSRVSGTADIVVGTPVANRLLPELEPLIGFFVNTLALRTDLSGDPPFRELVRRVAAVCLDAYEHQGVPFERLVEELQPERSLARTPLFQVMFSYQNVPFPQWDNGPVSVRPIPLESRKAEFDLLLDLFEDGETVWGRLEYSADIFDPATVRHLAAAFEALLAAAADDPGRRLGELRFEGTDERWWAGYLSRLDRQEGLRGLRVDVAGTESALCRLGPVHEAAVLARHGTRLVAYLTGEQVPGAGELTAYLAERLPDYLVPADYVLLPAFPRTRDGLIDRAALPDVQVIRPQQQAPFLAPRDDMERSIARIWGELLRVPRVGVNDNFFELGGHSLLATKLAAQIMSAHDVKLPLVDLFDHPTVAQLATRVADQKRHGAAAVIPAADRGAALPLSFTQEWLCRHHPMGIDDPYHNVPTAIVLTGDLDAGALRRSLDDLVQRHEVLRTRIAGRAQVISPAGGWPLEMIDLRGQDEASRDAALRRIVAAEGRRPFQVAAGPVIRAALIATAPREHVLLLVMHHLVTDNWSYGVLVRDLCELYEARRLGRPPELPRLPIGYADYAAWQRAQLASGALASQAGYWRQELRGLPPALRFGAPEHQLADAATGHATGFLIGRDATRALTQLAEQESATLFMVAMAAFQLLLAAYSGGDDIAVSFPVAGRGQPETAQLIGYFVNHLVVRTELAGDPTFRQLVRQVRGKTLGAYAHPDLPLWSLAGEDGGGTGPFRIIFNLLNAPIPVLDLPGLRAAPLHTGGTYVFSEVVADLEPAEADLALIMREDGGQLRGTWLYCLDRVDARVMAAMMRAFVHVTGLVAGHQDTGTAQLRHRIRQLAPPPGRAPTGERG
jgi:non-ribosomal peptide synthetase component F/acyl carrier protein